MRVDPFRTKVAAAMALAAGLAAAPRLTAGWGFAEGWEIVKGFGFIEQTSSSGLDIFDMAGQYPASLLGLDDDCDGFIDGGFFLGEKKEAEKLLSMIPMEEVAFLGGVLTEKCWSGFTIIDPTTWQDMILLSYGEPPPEMTVSAPMVIDVNEPVILDKSSPLLYKCLGFLIAVSQVCPARYEWDFDCDGVVDRMGYWGNKKPVFLGPGIPPGGGQDTITVTDNNVPARTATYYVGGNLPETLGPGKIIVPNSNMGFKLNCTMIEDPGIGGPDPLSNMGFKLNYTLWQGEENPEMDWWGHCDAWASSSWLLIPEPGPTATKKIVGICLGSAAAAFGGNKQTDGCEVNVDMPPPMEEVSFRYSGSGQMVLFYAGNGWTCTGPATGKRVHGAGPAAVILMEGEGWSMKITKKIDKGVIGGGGGGEEDIVFLTPEYNPLAQCRGACSTVNCRREEEAMTWEWEPATNTWFNLLMDAEDRESFFVRGETNMDSLAGPDISDGIFILQWLFAGGREPICGDAADVNDDGKVDISDGIGLLVFLFIGGSPPKAPFPGAGGDPTPDSLGCDLLR